MNKECPDGKILNKETGRCVDVNGKIGKQIIKEQDEKKKKKTKPKSKSKPKSEEDEKKYKECPDGKILNKKTGKCVDVNGKIGKQIIKEQDEKKKKKSKSKSPKPKSVKNSYEDDEKKPKPKSKLEEDDEKKHNDCPSIDRKKFSKKINSVKGTSADSSSLTDIYIIKLDDGRDVYMKVFSMSTSVGHKNLQYEFFVYLIKVKYLSLVSPNFVTPIAGKLYCKSDEIIDYLDGRVQDKTSNSILDKDELMYRFYRNLTITNISEARIKKRPSIQEELFKNLYGYIVTGPSLKDNYTSMVTLESLNRALYEANVFEIITQLAVACYCMKSVRLVHNDLHSGNVLVYIYDKPKNIQYNLDSVKINISTKYVIKIFDFDRSNMDCFISPSCSNEFSKSMINSGQDMIINDMKDFVKTICYLPETSKFKRAELVLRDIRYLPDYLKMFDKDCFYKRKSISDHQWSIKFNMFSSIEDVLKKLSSKFKMDTGLKYEEYDLQSSKIRKEINEYEEHLKKCQSSSPEKIYSFLNL